MEVRDFFKKIGDICDNIPPDDCDECPISGGFSPSRYNYCPNCGILMNTEEDDED